MDRKSVEQYQAEIQQRLVEASSRFYLVDSKTPDASYQVLWYCPPASRSNTHPAAVKIDILLPGATRIHSFNPSRINYGTEDLPVAPLSLVLLHKLQGWSIHLRSQQSHRHEKHHQDSLDVAQLVPIAARRGVKATDPALSSELVEKAARWVNRFIMKYPEFRTTRHWRKIGFSTAT